MEAIKLSVWKCRVGETIFLYTYVNLHKNKVQLIWAKATYVICSLTIKGMPLGKESDRDKHLINQVFRP